jgi:hypothetical protein
MNRYKDTRKQKKENNVTYYKTTIFDKVPKSNDDIYVLTQSGDRLDLLAYQFYGDISLWWYIARANNLFSINVPPNIQLRIPGTTKFARGK